MKRARPHNQAPASSSFPTKGVRSRSRSAWRAAARRIVRRALFSFPVTLRIGLEFDTADVQQDWWLPWFHGWLTRPGEHFSIGCRVGVLGVHLVVSITVFDWPGWANELADLPAAYVDGPVTIAHRAECRTNQPGFEVGDGCNCDFGARMRAYLEGDE